MGDPARVRAQVWIRGRVQGVAYRAFAQRRATQLELTGMVRNLDDGRVEAEVEGPREAIEALLDQLRQGPPLARVDDLQAVWGPPTGRWTDFHITD